MAWPRCRGRRRARQGQAARPSCPKTRASTRRKSVPHPEPARCRRTTGDIPDPPRAIRRRPRIHLRLGSVRFSSRLCAFVDRPRSYHIAPSGPVRKFANSQNLFFILKGAMAENERANFGPTPPRPHAVRNERYKGDFELRQRKTPEYARSKPSRRERNFWMQRQGAKTVAKLREHLERPKSER